VAIAITVSTLAAYAARELLGFLGDSPTNIVAALRALVVTLVDVAVFLVLARLLHLREVTEVVNTVTGRLHVGRRRTSYDGS